MRKPFAVRKYREEMLQTAVAHVRVVRVAAVAVNAGRCRCGVACVCRVCGGGVERWRACEAVVVRGQVQRSGGGGVNGARGAVARRVRAVQCSRCVVCSARVCAARGMCGSACSVVCAA